MLQYYLFYKPFQVLSQFSEEGDKKTLAHFFPHLPKDIYPAGRLDYDSEGLLLLTNDKQLSHQLTDPAYGHERTYLVQLEGIVTDAAIDMLQRGVVININGKPHHTLPAVALRVNDLPPLPERHPPIRYRKDIPTSWLSLTLTEGKNRQVRRMTAATGFPTLRLIRYSIGNVTMEGLEPGSYRREDETICQALLQKSGK